MKIVRKITINTPAADAWKVLGDEFVPAHLWMAGIKNSNEITEGRRVQNAPAIGRRAEIGVYPGSYLDEIITAYDPEAMTLTVDTTLVNAPKGTPVKGYNTEIAVRSLGDNASEVIWASRGYLHPMGYFLYPVLKKV